MFKHLKKVVLFSITVFISLIIFGLQNSNASENQIFGDTIQPRGSLSNCRTIFEKTKKGNVAFLGGSITEMNGYRPMVSDYLQKTFPNTEFSFTNAGISSTCSNTGAFRLKTDVLNKQVDLLFVEFAVNDDQDAHHSRKNCIRGMEGIIRQARLTNPNMDIVITFFVNEGMLKSLQEGKVPLTVEAHETVSKHYEISTINLAKEVATQITKGTLTWKQYGGVHPAPFGNAICAKMIEELFQKSWKDSKSTTIIGHKLPEPLDQGSYFHGRFINPSKAKIKSGWTFDIPDWKNLKGGKRERFTSTPVLHATNIGSEASLEFEGTAIGAFVIAGPDAGIVLASLDGGPAKPVNLFHSYSKGLHYPRTVIFADDLKPGKHKITLGISKETQSEGNAARILQFCAN